MKRLYLSGQQGINTPIFINSKIDNHKDKFEYLQMHLRNPLFLCVLKLEWETENCLDVLKHHKTGDLVQRPFF